MPQKPTTIDEYVATFPEAVQERLQKIRNTAQELAPDAAEAISYGIPTFRLNGVYLVYFGGWKNYISMYPLPGGDAAFEAEIGQYRAGKGTARFLHKEPLPVALIERLIHHSIAANSARSKK